MGRKNRHKSNQGYPAYDDRFYDIESIVSTNDCTGLVPTPPKSEYEAESYSDLLNIPQPKGEVDNGLQRIQPDKVENK